MVIVLGSCGLTCGVFHNAYHGAGPVDAAIRAVDPNAIIAYVAGCPPKPEAMISAVVKLIAKLKGTKA